MASSLVFDGREYAVSAGGITIGRGPDNDLVLPSEQASRHHARVWQAQGSIYIRDLGSKNGTQLNGRKIAGDAILHTGDRIHIAGLVLTVSDAAAGLDQPFSPPLVVQSPTRLALLQPKFALIGATIVVVICLLGAGIFFFAGGMPSVVTPTSVALQPSLAPSPTATSEATPTTHSAPKSTATATPSVDAMNSILKAVVLIEVPMDNSRTSMGGSGTVVHPRGFVLTNAHVVRDEKTGKPFNSRGLIFVIQGDDPTRAPDQVYRAQLVTVDDDLDLALLRVTHMRDGSPLPDELAFSTIPLGNSDSVQIGQEIRVIGFPSLGGDTVTTSRGIVSGFVENGKWIKTDTEVNPGNSGGAAVNISGELIGVPSGVVSGRIVTGKLGYVLPINKAKAMLAQIKP